jgi:N-acetylglucosamine-6-phosphate deacetylase
MIEGIHYSSGNRVRIEISDGVISSMEETVKDHVWDVGEEKELPVVAPGLIDLQINGFRGVDFNDPDLTPEQIEKASEELLLTGVFTYYPTLITGSPEKISSLLATFAKALGQDGLASRMIGGIHLEGPFISKEDGPRGAHTRELCMNPNVELLKWWQEQANGKIKIITLAPELPGSVPFIKYCVSVGIVVGLGHTAAKTDQISSAVDAGATLSTHLGNGCHPTLPRHPNYIWDQLAQENLYASMIADGFHLPDSVLRVFAKSKGEKAILISDGMTYTGLKPGLYDSSSTGRVCLTPEGKLHQEGKPGTLAGSASSLLNGVRKMSSMVGFSKAWEMGSVDPAHLMNLETSKGLSVGAPAKLVLLEPDLSHLAIRSVNHK